MNKLLKKITFLIIIVGISAFWVACRLWGHHSEIYIPLSYKKYFYFDRETWWVYKNQSDVLDTLRIVDSKSCMEHNDNAENEDIEKINIKYHSKIVGNIEAIAHLKLGDDFHFCFNNIELSYFNNFVNLIYYESYNEKQSCHTKIDWSKIDTLTVNNKTYNDIIVNKAIDEPTLPDNYPLTCYYVANIGLIKKELKNGEIWELVDYEIKQKP
ncbi:MAG: hypothetical protein ACOXZ9_01915 [Bacteroidales bacterium]|jgi:hypothetical protein